MVRKNKLKVSLFALFFTASQLVGYTNYGEIQDPGVQAAVEGMRAFQVHYQNWMFYTINVHTPGYIETGVYNSRAPRKIDGEEPNHRIRYVPFFRFRAGPVMETGRDLDFYVDARSRGFFTIKLPTTIAYTRDGRFKLDSQNRLVTLAGNYPVMGDGGEIFMPEGSNSFSSSRSGQIYANGELIDRLKIAVFKNFSDMQKLESLNGAVFVLQEAIDILEGPEYYTVKNQHLEQNNVLKAINGDIGMAKNSYDASAKAAHLLNRSLSTVATLAAP